ncbi:hypothetical protein PT974_04052 [Cladobotryum mycophilum]|uniref:Uncharacterized protein n=1 Tax=Cladobotryum mycophilum TaxID=491253 RepID=A0ABR0STZ6_9HYPO
MTGLRGDNKGKCSPNDCSITAVHGGGNVPSHHDSAHCPLDWAPHPQNPMSMGTSTEGTGILQLIRLDRYSVAYRIAIDNPPDSSAEFHHASAAAYGVLGRWDDMLAQNTSKPQAPEQRWRKRPPQDSQNLDCDTPARSERH